MKIFIVDDSNSFRETIKYFIEDELKYEVVGECSNGQEFLNMDHVNTDIVLMDIHMPFVNGLDATKYGLWKNNTYKVIAVSLHDEGLTLEKLIPLGFRGFIRKQDVFEKLQEAINTVMKGKPYFSDSLKIK